jgi:hypothetical protein
MLVFIRGSFIGLNTRSRISMLCRLKDPENWGCHKIKYTHYGLIDLLDNFLDNCLDILRGRHTDHLLLKGLQNKNFGKEPKRDRRSDLNSRKPKI